MIIPVLETERLLLRPLTDADAPVIGELASDRGVASTTMIPHPYPPEHASAFLTRAREADERDEACHFAVVRKSDATLIGLIWMTIKQAHRNAELVYWYGKPFWGQGFATEAAGRVLQYGFDELGLNKIWAGHFTRNPASGRVMQKIGMRFDGIRRQELLKWGVFEDIAEYSILASEYRGGGVVPSSEC